MKKIIYILFGVLIVQVAQAQCGTDEYNRRLVQNSLTQGENYVDFIESKREFEYTTSVDPKTKKAIRTIPVVFHVLHAYGEENISKEQIEDQLRIINEDFQRKNADATSTRAVFAGRAANFELEFKLARKAPDGSCTEGITRHFEPVNMIEDYEDNNQEAKSAVPPWDASKYLNIWIVKEILSSGTGTILGYAQFPGQSASTDGVVMIHNRVGTIGTARATDKGRTLTHEIGHWLGLYHPFQGTWNSDGCSGNGDRVSDTPPVKEASFGCTAGSNPNTCNSDSPDEVDMVENFMDYANGGCMNAFTNGQLARVNAWLSSQTGRGTNVSAATLTATGVNTNPSCGPIADFWYSSDNLTICEGESVTYKDLSYDGAITTREWKFEGGSPATSADANPVITYNTAGTYKVEIKVSNAQGSDDMTRDVFVTVLPGTAGLKVPAGQDFESASATDEWELESDGNGNEWAENSFIGYSGNKSLEMKIDENTPRSLRTSAVMPPVDLSEYKGQVALHFKYAYARRFSNANEVLLVLVSEDCKKTWRVLTGGVFSGTKLETGTTSPDWTPNSKGDWARAEVDLSSYADNTNLFVKFDVISQSGNSVYIDDINVGTHALKTPSYESNEQLSIYPNPAQNEVGVFLAKNTSNTTVSIVDITGRLLLQQNLDPSKPTINTQSLSNGVYSVIVVSDDKKWSKKLIISK